MRILATALPECKLIEPEVFGDARGCFFESWNRQRFADHGLAFDVVQSNVSVSARGVLRGLHYQWPNPQGKLVSVLEGDVFDVAVDIRRGSPRFGQWAGVALSADNRRHFWIPEGFAHGFVVLSERAVFSYLCTTAYDATADAAIRFDDPDIGIAWGVDRPELSDKDASAPRLAEVVADRLPVFQP